MLAARSLLLIEVGVRAKSTVMGPSNFHVPSPKSTIVGSSVEELKTTSATTEPVSVTQAIEWPSA